MHIYISIYIYICIVVYVCTKIHKQTYIHKHIYVYIYIYIYINTYTYIFLCTSLAVSTRSSTGSCGCGPLSWRTAISVQVTAVSMGKVDNCAGQLKGKWTQNLLEE